MPAASGRGSLQFSVETHDFKRLFDKSSQVDKTLRNGLRKHIRTAAQVAAKDVQRTVLRPPLRPGKAGRHTGLRARIAAGVKVQILTGNTRVGVAVTAGGSNLVRAYTKSGGWRHPVFGNTAVWVTQIGRPGFFHQTVAAHRPEVTRAVTAAMQEAAASLGGN